MPRVEHASRGCALLPRQPCVRQKGRAVAALRAGRPRLRLGAERRKGPSAGWTPNGPGDIHGQSRRCAKAARNRALARWEARGSPTPSDGEALAALVATTLERHATRASRHALTESVCAGALALLGLVRALHWASNFSAGRTLERFGHELLHNIGSVVHSATSRHLRNQAATGPQHRCYVRDRRGGDSPTGQPPLL